MIKFMQILKENDSLDIVDWDEYVRPNHVLIKLSNGKTLKFSESNIKGGRLAYQKILHLLNEMDKNPKYKQMMLQLVNQAAQNLSESKKEVKLPSSLKRLIDEANMLILDSTNNDWYAIEADGTWESVYKFKPITVKGKYIHIEYTEPLDRNRKVKDKWEIDGYDGIENVRWVLKCLKKGYRQKDR